MASSHVFIQSVNFYLSFCCVCIGVVICIVIHLRYTLHYVLFAPEKSPAFMAMHTAVPLRVQNYISCAKLFFCLNSSPLLTTFTSHQTMQAPPRSKHCIMGYHQRIIYWRYVRVCCSFPNWSNLIFPGIHSLTLLPPSTPPPLDISPHTQDKVEKHQKPNMILIKMQFTKRRGERSWWLRITTATFFSNSTRGSMMIKKMMMMIVTIILMIVASWQDYSGLSDLGVLKTACPKVPAPRRREKGGENCTLQKRQSSSGGDRWLKKDKHHDSIMSQF